MLRGGARLEDCAAPRSAPWRKPFSRLHAPLQMLWHSKFVVTILRGTAVNWGPQKRIADGIAWSEAICRHWGHTLVGSSGSAGLAHRSRHVLVFMPVLAGMVLSIP